MAKILNSDQVATTTHTCHLFWQLNKFSTLLQNNKCVRTLTCSPLPVRIRTGDLDMAYLNILIAIILTELDG